MLLLIQYIFQASVYTNNMGRCSVKQYLSVFAPPVQIRDQALLVAAQQLAQQLLMFHVETQVIGDGERLQGQAGERLHKLIAVKMQAEVVASLRLSRHNRSVL